MKIVGLIPYWTGYLDTGASSHKNLKKLGGKYLINYSIELLGSTPEITNTFIYSSNESVLDYINSSGAFEYRKRPDYLDNNDIAIETIIDEFISDVDADIVVLLHPNSPFLTRETLLSCIHNVANGAHDSAFTAYTFNKLAWFKGKPLNYSLKSPTPKLCNLEPVILEQSSLYVFSTQHFKENNKRIGEKPYIHFINHFEGHDINTDADYEIAELIVNSGMYSGY